MDPAALRRFAADLQALLPEDRRLGIAVSGGPDSLALLLLANAARPGTIEAATVDHGLRAESRDEARMVAALCERIGVAHATLPADWPRAPTANVQAEARRLRYRLLTDWARDRGLAAVATAHHADDQAETLLMRLARGAGLAGLGGTRARRSLAEDVLLVRPLLGWRKADLDLLVRQEGIIAADDPTNRDPHHDRVRIRQALADAEWLDPSRLAASAAALREAEEALDWALAPLVEERLHWQEDESLALDPAGLPRELLRRLLLAGFAQMGAAAPRGPELSRAMDALGDGRTATLSGLKLEPGARWRLSVAPPRR